MKSEHCELAVIVPVYNLENIIAETIGSILSQSYADFILVIVDDGSTDQTKKVIQRFAVNDSRIHLLSQTNHGPGKARNVGLSYAKKFHTKYTMILDGDDLYSTAYFQKMINSAKSSMADVVVCDSNFLNAKNSTITSATNNIRFWYLNGKKVFSPEDIKDYIFSFCVGWSWDKLYLSSLIYKNKLQFQEIPNTDDAYFVYISLIKARKIFCIDEKLVTHRILVSNSISASRDKHTECMWTAVYGIKQKLVNDRVYEIYERGYVNWALNFIIWYLKTLSNNDVRHKLYSKTKNEYFLILNFDKYEPNYFYYKRDYEAYKTIMNRNYKTFVKTIVTRNKLREKMIKAIRKYKFLNFIYKILKPIYDKIKFK